MFRRKRSFRRGFRRAVGRIRRGFRRLSRRRRRVSRGTSFRHRGGILRCN